MKKFLSKLRKDCCYEIFTYLQRGAIKTPLSQLHLQKGLLLNQFYWFIQNTANARREGGKNTSSSVVDKAMKVNCNSSYRYQTLDRAKHSKIQSAVRSEIDKLFNDKTLKT